MEVSEKPLKIEKVVKFNTDKRDALSGSGAKKGYIVLSIKEAQRTVSTIEEKKEIILLLSLQRIKQRKYSPG